MKWTWADTTTYSSAAKNVTMTTVNTTPAADVLVSGCLNNFNTIACIRSSILTFLAVLTAVLCVLKVIKLHHAHHQNWHQYFIFYCASLECTVAAVHFVLHVYVQFDFVLQWLKLAQFLVMCHFYWTLATRALRREIWTKRFLIPFLVIACIYFTTVATMGIANVQDTYSECFQPYWLMMSSAEFLIVQLFCVAGFYITRRLNEISTLDSLRRSQKRDLWCIVVVFELSALIGVLYDMTLRIIGDKQNGCSAIFKHAQEVFSVIFFSFMVVKLLLPIWVMLFVFKPTPQVTVESDDLIPALTGDENSAFSANIDEQYRQLYHPADTYRTLMYDSPTASSPVSDHSPVGPVGSVNTVVVNGVGKNAYRTVALPSNNQITSKNEGRIGQVKSGEQSLRHRASLQKQNSFSEGQQKKTSNGNDKSEKQTVYLQQRDSFKGVDDSQAKVRESQTKQSSDIDLKNQSKSYQPIRAEKQAQRVESKDDIDAVTSNQTAESGRKEGPKFTIDSNSDDEDVENSPPQKGNFFI